MSEVPARPPLGGSAPVPEPSREDRDPRRTALVAVLLVTSLVAGASTLMSWRDMGRRFGMTATETGWTRIDGSFGRGWITLVLAVLVAVAGILLASGRDRAGRVLAVCAGSGLVLAAVLEWGLGIGAVRWGPGLGLWVELIVGVAIVVSVGALEPPNTRAG